MGQSNPHGKEAFDKGIRAALTTMLTGDKCRDLDKDSHKALRHVRDNIKVPNDMSIWAAKRLRQACEDTACQQAPKQEYHDSQNIVDERAGSPQFQRQESNLNSHRLPFGPEQAPPMPPPPRPPGERVPPRPQGGQMEGPNPYNYWERRNQRENRMRQQNMMPGPYPNFNQFPRNY